MKIRRSERLIDMTKYLIENPAKLISLNFFAERYQSAKSSVSEDLVLIKTTLEKNNLGRIETIAGAGGGVKYIASFSPEETSELFTILSRLIEEPGRILPGGYLYMNDILGDSRLLQKVGKMIATKFADKHIDVIMTIATKGIPIAYATASQLNVPVVIVRRDSLVTEGPTVSINYISGSTKRIQTMVLSKRSLPEEANVLIVDDFMKAGGTIRGMISLLAEFKANLIGTAVLAEASYDQERLVEDYLSFIKIVEVNEKDRTIKTEPGNFKI